VHTDTHTRTLTLSPTHHSFGHRCNYGDIRLAHADAAAALDGVSYAVSFDHGHAGIHTPHKSEVGRRLALKVLSMAYGESVDAANGPVLAGACSLTQTSTPGQSVEPIGTVGNGTRVRLLLTNADTIKLQNTMECETQTPVCCNETKGGPPGAAVGLAQIQFCDVWRGGAWFDAAVCRPPHMGATLNFSVQVNGGRGCSECGGDWSQDNVGL
jgi:hypothetical protein